MIPNYSPFGQSDPESPYKGLNPECPNCHCKMEDIFAGYANNVPTTEWWECSRCYFKKPKYIVPPPKPSGIAILPSSPSAPEMPKSVPVDESKYFDPKRARRKRIE